MITLDEAFRKFKSRQELTDREQRDVSNRHIEVRNLVAKDLKIQRDFLTGSYARWTKTKPFRDVDVFCVLHADEASYRDQHPRVILERIRDILVPTYGEDRVVIDVLAVTVSFGIQVDEDDDTDGKVMSIDVVPAFTKDGHFEIPNDLSGRWIETDPEVHYDLAREAHDAYSKEWKPLVRMIKKWNRHHGRPVQPSFLLEIMALELLVPPFSGGYPYELKSFFADAADRIHDDWPDPAGLGPVVSGSMTAAQKDRARNALLDAERLVSQALNLARQDRNGDALRVWREIFGPQFPLS